MSNNNYTTTIEVARSPKEVFNAITDVANWWTTDFSGNSAKLNDEFVVNHPNLHYSKQRLVEVIPDKKIVWLVAESKLDWLKKDKQEWTNTRMIFELEPKGNNTLLHFTHKGLLPEKECYASCEKGWNLIIRDWLLHLITVGTPSPGMTKAAEIRNEHFQNMRKNAKSFRRSIAVNTSPAQAMKKISQINHWWKTDFTGHTEQLNQKFTVPFGDPAFVDFTVSAAVPEKQLAWKVTDCYLPWFEDKKEWNNTEVVFELTPENGKTRIDFAHHGLEPQLECYDVCEKGWNGHINNLATFINEGKSIAE